MELTTDPGLRLNAYTAEAGSPDQEALNLLASWTTPLVKGIDHEHLDRRRAAPDR